uniref:Sulfotransferase family protein n=1 Tax=Pithovirus LCPAC201 TaxID=2506591 RepID=A0A481Z5J6_9VIRU|nr:MAG: sulfotransferase family protein [Pithovirus LCPAC201]
MLIVESDGLFMVFIHIPKTAGTTLRQILELSLKIHFAKPNSSRSNSSKAKSSSENIEIMRDLKEKAQPRVICYGYWNISDGIDLAHVPFRFFQNYYPPNPDWIGNLGKSSETKRFDRRVRTDHIKVANLLQPVNGNDLISRSERLVRKTQTKRKDTDKSRFIWITCVRNPYARIYSAYCWHKKEKRLPSSPEGFRFFLIVKLREIVKNYNQSFIENRPPSPEYIHFIPMWMMVSDRDGIPKVDHIIRQEEFDQQVPALLKKLNLPIPNKYSNIHCRNKSPPPSYDYLKYYDQETLELIETLYSRDFELFGYRRLAKI